MSLFLSVFSRFPHFKTNHPILQPPEAFYEKIGMHFLLYAGRSFPEINVPNARITSRLLRGVQARPALRSDF